MCAQGGLWTPTDDPMSAVILNKAILVNEAAGYRLQGKNYRQLTQVFRDKGGTLYNSSLVALNTGNITYANGVVGPPVLGFLNVGWSRNTNLSFAFGTNSAIESMTSYTLPGGLWVNGVIPSYTYGLHIGSAALGYTGSLVFGGFDAGRIIGDYATYSLSGDETKDTTKQAGPQLLDIVIGVEDGGSPFSGFSNQSNLLLDESSTTGSFSTGGVEVQVDPTDPYLHLSPQTCARIASFLPVRYDSILKYYVWNTTDPSYQRIITSPAYLGFIFSSGNTQTTNITIKVPLTLLNLTLTAPITQTPVQYFPCVPHNLNASSIDDSYALGRAFLQAAYVGANWNRAIGWLGQAPGPGNAKQGLGPGAKDLQDSDTSLSGVPTDPELFKRSWEGVWTSLPLPAGATATPTPTSNTAKSSGVSIGAKAGIGVGAALGMLVLVVVGLLIIRRRRNGGVQGGQFHDGRGEYTISSYLHEKDCQGPPGELSGESKSPPELSAVHSPVELSVRSPVELSSESIQEMYAGKVTSHTERQVN
ncbi:Hypothetical protein D9617_1g086220 [Elsinoe fawcettii]|nr:Hypothetical protein D9617_1g086220 [Elsinoe fawcettii]